MGVRALAAFAVIGRKHSFQRRRYARTHDRVARSGGVMQVSWKTVAPLAIWLGLFLWPTPVGLTASQWHYFAIFAAVIAALVLESMPVGAVGLIGLTAAGLSGYVESDPAKSLRGMLSGCSESTVWLIVGAFVFSIGYRKSGLGRRIALLLVRALGRRTIGLGYAVTFSDLLLAPATPSNTARSGGTIYPIIINIPKIYGSEPGPTATRIGTYVMWTAFAATGVTSSLFLTALAPNAAALAIAKKTVNVDVGWAQWFLGFAPLGIVLILLVPLLSFLVCRPEVRESPEIAAWAANELKGLGPMSRHELIMAALVVVAMFLWITGSSPQISLPWLGSNYINATAVVFLVISLMLVSGVVEFGDIVAEKPAWEVFFYFTSLLTLASGLNEIGLIKWFANAYAAQLSALSASLALVLLFSLFFWIHYCFSSITSHTAAMLPVVLSAGAAIPGLPTETLTLVCVYSLGLMGVISPYATGPAPMYYGSGYIRKGAFWGFGLIFGVVYFVGLLALLPWLWKAQ
jgi:anion transporter